MIWDDIYLLQQLLSFKMYPFWMLPCFRNMLACVFIQTSILFIQSLMVNTVSINKWIRGSYHITKSLTHTRWIRVLPFESHIWWEQRYCRAISIIFMWSWLVSLCSTLMDRVSRTWCKRRLYLYLITPSDTPKEWLAVQLMYKKCRCFFKVIWFHNIAQYLLM